jgi:hypothetical protein
MQSERWAAEGLKAANAPVDSEPTKQPTRAACRSLLRIFFMMTVSFMLGSALRHRSSSMGATCYKSGKAAVTSVTFRTISGMAGVMELRVSSRPAASTMMG